MRVVRPVLQLSSLLEVSEKVQERFLGATGGPDVIFLELKEPPS
jgi:hypothetical protein